jgi:hypothetical protein
MALSPIVAQAILEQRGPDIAGRFQAGREQQRAEQARALTGQVLAGQGVTGPLAELFQKSPEQATALSNALQIPINQPERFKRFAERATLINEIGKKNPQLAFSEAVRYRDELAQQGLPAPRVNEFISEFQQDPQQAMKNLGIVVRGLQSLQPQARQAGIRAFAPVTLVDKETGEKRLVTPTFNPNTGKAEISQFDIPAGFEVSKETPEEERVADVLAAGETEKVKAISKGSIARANDTIDIGLDAARNLATVRRGLEVLNTVETGGIDKASLIAKQFFGVESANEAELSSLLGKAVLGQLRSTFGAQFTEREGARLERIEAGFGKSTAGNRRLLKQTMQIMERAANRGIKAAESIEDADSAEEIRAGIEFRLQGDPADNVAQPTVGQVVGQAVEGAAQIIPQAQQAVQTLQQAAQPQQNVIRFDSQGNIIP